MKYRKKMQVLRGVTALRVKLGISQFVFAQYLGVSKSLISMVENSRRHLPLAAMVKLSQLEMHFHEQGTLPAVAETDSSTGEIASLRKIARQCRENINRLRLSQLGYELQQLKATRQETLEALQHLEAMLTYAAADPNCNSLFFLQQEKRRLLKKLAGCDALAQAKMEGKIAMLEIITASYEASSKQYNEPTESACGEYYTTISLPAPDHHMPEEGKGPYQKRNPFPKEIPRRPAVKTGQPDIFTPGNQIFWKKLRLFQEI